MTTKRIKDLSVEATSSTLTDNDYGVVDSTANGTRKFKLSALATWVLGRIKSLATTITAFRTGDVIPVDGPEGTAKMSKDTLLELTAQNALAGNTLEVKDFDPTRTSENPYLPGESCIYGGRVYIFRVPHYGPWNISDVNQRRSIASFDASIKILNRRKIPTNSYSMVYSDEFDLLYRIPVVAGDIITFNS